MFQYGLYFPCNLFREKGSAAMGISGNGAAEKQTVWSALDGFHIELPS